MNKTIAFLAACSEVKTEPATNATWFQTFPPYGRYPVGGTVEGAKKDSEYILDEAAAKKIIDAFNKAKERKDWPGVLVDEEHFSLDASKSSAALAWAKDVRQDEDGSIWTRWEFTPKGRELWEKKVLVNRSPAFAAEKVGKDFRPVELISIGMTNTPHFSELSTLAAARAAEVNHTQKETTMKKIIEELGLGEDASEDAAVAAIKSLKEKASAAEAKATDAEQKAEEEKAKCRKMECDAFLEANKAKIADVAACREVFMESPEAAKKMIAACKAVEPKPQIVLGAAKATPKIEKNEVVGTCREQMAALPPAERAAFYQAHQQDIDAGK